jgi:hypothetical protein
MTSTGSGDHLERPRVLISQRHCGGSGVGRIGCIGRRPTVIERVADLRGGGGGGHAADLFGPVVELMDWLGAYRRSKARTQTEVIALIRPARRPVDVPAEVAERAAVPLLVGLRGGCPPSSSI